MNAETAPSTARCPVEAYPQPEESLTTVELQKLSRSAESARQLRAVLDQDQPDLLRSVDRTMNSLTDKISESDPDKGDIYRSGMEGLRAGFNTAFVIRMDRLINEYSADGADPTEFLRKAAEESQRIKSLLLKIATVDGKSNISLEDLRQAKMVNGLVDFMDQFMPKDGQLPEAPKNEEEKVMQKDNLKKSTIDYFVRAARTAAQAEITYGQIKPEELDGGATPTDLLQKDLQIAVRFLAGAEQNYQNKVIFDPRLTPADFIEIKKSVWEKLSSAERQIFQRAFDGDGESRESAAYLLETEEDSEKPRAIAAQQEYAADIEAAIAEDKSDTSGTPLGKYGDVWGVGFYIYQYIATAGLAIGLLTNPSGFLTDPVTLAYAAVGAGFAGHYGLFDGKLQTPGVRSREDLADMLAATERKQEYQKYKPILSAIRETQFQPDSALAGLLREKTLAGEITTADLTADLLQHDVQPDGLPKIESGSSEARWLFSFLADCVEGQVNPKELIAQAEN